MRKIHGLNKQRARWRAERKSQCRWQYYQTFGQWGDRVLAGIDIIEIERFKQSVERTPALLSRIFTPGELDYCRQFSNPYPSMAARFAAKEAVKKLHHGLLDGVRFQDIEVINDPQGKPEVHLHGKAAEHHQKVGMGCIALSISHSRDTAVAMAVARKGE